MRTAHADFRVLCRGWPMGLAAAMLAACACVPAAGPHATTESDTSYRAVAKGDLTHYELALGEVSTGAVPAEHPAPAYPPSLLGQRLPPQEVEARLVVDEQGRVSEVRIEDEAQADARTRLFDEAVRATAMQWTFEPLRISQWAADADGNTHEVGSQTRPFSLDYVFRFAWRDGRPVADASASGRATP